jgi:hypothetical protein
MRNPADTSGSTLCRIALGVMILSTAAASAPVELRGQLLSKSDVQDIPDQPLGLGDIILLRLDTWRALTSTLGVDDRPERAYFRVEYNLLASLGAERAPVGKDGNFSMSAAPGQSVLCVANYPRPPKDDAEPAAAGLSGCAQLVVPATGTTVKVLLGIGGLEVVADR